MTLKDPAAEGAAEAAVPWSPERDEAGGIAETLAYEDILRIYGKRKDSSWTPRERRVYASALMQCFLKRWFEAKNAEAAERNRIRAAARAAAALLARPIPWITDADGDAMPFVGSELGDTLDRYAHGNLIVDEPLPYPPAPGHEYETGNSEAGVATEERMIAHMKEVYGHEGTILKHIRIRRPLLTDEGETAWIIARTDPFIVGDDLRPLHLFEVKSSLFWKKKLEDLARSVPQRRAPLTLAGIDAPDQEGLVNVNQVVQLAVESDALARRGLDPARKSMLYVDRTHYNRHLEVMVTTEQARFLADLGDWWALEHLSTLKDEKPPAPRWFMEWECKYCAFREDCDKVAAEKKLKREPHPVVIGINARLQQAGKTGEVKTA